MRNAPNFRHFFHGGPRQYISTILRVGSQAVRDADPSAYVLGPELAQEDGWWLWLYTVPQHAAEAIDIVTPPSYHDTGQDVLRRSRYRQGLGG